MRSILKPLALLPMLIAFIFGKGIMIDDSAWISKVDPQVLEIAEEGEAEFIVFLHQQADLQSAKGIRDKFQRGAYVYEKLTSIAKATQGPILRTLASHGVEYQPFWVTNMIWVKGDKTIVEILARRPDVKRLYNNPRVKLDIPPKDKQFYETTQYNQEAASLIGWGISKVRAPEVWAAGYTGQGVVIGGQDTGYDWDHPALKDKYRGWDSGNQTVNHDYNWHDAIHIGSGGVCGLDSPEPCDDESHGTHTMGIMVGDDGAGMQIGMAPGAKWIGCRNMDQGLGTPARYIECYEWFIAPWPIGGDPFNDGDPSKAPHVINNSWSCPADEGCDNPEILLTVVQNVRAAGILTVHSAGNDGSCPDSGTQYTPAAIYDESFSVGSTDQNDNISNFSSEGPAIIGDDVFIKPDVVAPGQDIYSSVPNGNYDIKHGTSMAAPHVAGLAALLISAQPELAGQVDLIETLITHNTVPRTSSRECGGVPGYQIPNNTYGWGRVDAKSVVENALQPYDFKKTASSYLLHPGEVLTYTIDLTQLYPISMTNIIISDVLPSNVSFIDATDPYIRNGDTIRWDIDTLGPGVQHSVQLIVEMPSSDGLWSITNQLYGVHSSELPSIIYGSPLSVTVATEFQFLPMISSGP